MIELARRPPPAQAPPGLAVSRPASHARTQPIRKVSSAIRGSRRSLHQCRAARRSRILACAPVACWLAVAGMAVRLVYSDVPGCFRGLKEAAAPVIRMRRSRDAKRRGSGATGSSASASSCSRRAFAVSGQFTADLRRRARRARRPKLSGERILPPVLRRVNEAGRRALEIRAPELSSRQQHLRVEASPARNALLRIAEARLHPRAAAGPQRASPHRRLPAAARIIEEPPKTSRPAATRRPCTVARKRQPRSRQLMRPGRRASRCSHL